MRRIRVSALRIIDRLGGREPSLGYRDFPDPQFVSKAGMESSRSSLHNDRDGARHLRSKFVDVELQAVTQPDFS